MRYAKIIYEHTLLFASLGDIYFLNVAQTSECDVTGNMTLQMLGVYLGSSPSFPTIDIKSERTHRSKVKTFAMTNTNYLFIT